MRPLRTILAAPLILCAGGAAAEPVRCAPDYPTFCANLHVGCAGRSDVPTPGFEIDDDAGIVRFDHGEVASVSGNRSHSGVVYRGAAGDWWIRIDPGGRFSHRVRGPHGALMSVGACAPG